MSLATQIMATEGDYEGHTLTSYFKFGETDHRVTRFYFLPFLLSPIIKGIYGN